MNDAPTPDEVDVPRERFLTFAMQYLRAGGRLGDFPDFCLQGDATREAWAQAGDRVFVERALVFLALLQGDEGPIHEAFVGSEDMEEAEIKRRLQRVLGSLGVVR